MTDRRLPVYLLIDCSESMAGSAIEDVRRGIDTLASSLKGNPLALETVYLSVITFSRYAKQVSPLTELFSFQPPVLSVRPGTAFGAAVDLLIACINREVVKTSPTAKGDYRPIVFLLTDGQPTDDWRSAAARLKGANNPRLANIYAIGCGPDVDTSKLREFTDVVLRMPEMTPESFKKTFVWLSASISSASTRLGHGDGISPIDMPALPDVLELSTSDQWHDPEPRQVFLQARCQKSGRPYLMRFGKKGNLFCAIASHKLDSIEPSDSNYLSPINTSLLSGCPACPYCENEEMLYCNCGSIMCFSTKHFVSATCPNCKTQIEEIEYGDYDIRRAEG
jgi:uncharacterized protein YegL